jgi:iron complex transport system substrate-binding protein
MMKLSLSRLIWLMVLGVVIFMLISAWGRTIDHKTIYLEQPLKNCRFVHHAMGETCIPKNPRRIVTLDRISFSTAIALGIKPVGTIEYTSTEYDAPYLAGKIDGVTFIRSARGQPNLEKILLLKSDLIIANSSFQDIYQQSSQIASTILVSFPVSNQGRWQEYLKNFAVIFGKTETAHQLLKRYEQQVEQLKKALGNNRPPIRVSFLYVFYGTVQTVSKNSFVGKILDDLGLDRPPNQANSSAVWLPISEETIQDIDGDILFVLAFRVEDNSYLKQWANKPLWSQLKAVQQNRVYQVKVSIWDGRNILAAYAVLDDIEKYLT